MQVTQKLDEHLFTLNEQKWTPNREVIIVKDTHFIIRLYYFPCGGFVVTDQEKKVFCQSGVSGAQTRDFRHGAAVKTYQRRIQVGIELTTSWRPDY